MEIEEPRLVSFRIIEKKRLRWLWPGKIPLGKVSLLVGVQGVSKSTLSLYMAAQVSTGRPWADSLDANEPGDVIILTTEDDLSDTVSKRLEAAGANIDRIFTIQSKMVHTDKASGRTMSRDFGMSNLTDDIEVLRKLGATTNNLRLIIIDPISAYMKGMDSNKNTDVREFMTPLADVATGLRCSIVGISHFNKNQDLMASSRVLGSIGFVASARAVWYVIADPEDRKRILLLPSKQNLSKNTTGLAYRLMSQQVEAEGKMEDWAFCYFEDEPISMSIEELMSPFRPKGRPRKKEDAGEWLTELLADGAMDPRTILDMGKEAGYSESTLRRAKSDLDIQSISAKNEDGKVISWEWALLG